ncbi:MAG: M23 family metallopeptidase [Bacteroidia bacterium]|nr:M23 family metallopeptidase [Bacteroidia bacterium]MDW8134022.1 M23 family metallopeptidase [Bacteroidia bacterium]
MKSLLRRLYLLLVQEYRLLFIQERGTFQFQLRLAGWGWLGFLLVLGGLVWLIFAFTPLRYTVPGYPTSRFRYLYATLLERVRLLEQKVSQHLALVEELRKLQGVMRSEPSQGFPLFPTLQSGQYILPTDGRVSRPMEPAKEHWGIDITCAPGDPVLAIAEGTVIFAEYSYQTGYVIAIQHPNGLISIYKHNSRLLRRVGEKVKVGDVITLAGGLGMAASGPHLHVETWLGGIPLDPLKLLSYRE